MDRVFSGEQPLLVFISSVMRPELAPSRELAVETFGRAPFLSPWAFEFTPASSEPVDQGYLRKVREADFVVWLVGRDVTQPVQNEIREAIGADRRLLVFLLPTDSRDPETDALLQEVRTRAKWVDVKGEVGLEYHLQLALTDEIIRAVRAKPSLSRLSTLEELGRASRGRCIARWQALGVSRLEAARLADDPTVRSSDPLMISGPDRPVVLFVGEVGIGKSLIVERLHQSAIARSREDAGAPTPVYLDARDDFGALASAVEASAEGLGNPRVQGAAVVLDSAEDQGGARALELLTQARILVNTWPQTTVVMAGRPLLPLREAEEAVEVAPLPQEQAWALVSTHAGYELGSAWGWPQSIADAVTRPLFAILLGLQLRDRSFWRPKSTGELLSSLSERVISSKMGPEARAVLERLAVLSTNSGGASVPSTEIGKRAEIEAVLESGLILERSASVRFSLPIVAQWFAAQSLARGVPLVQDLLRDARRLEWWRYPLVVAAGTLSHDDASKLLQPLAASDPGLTAQIVDEGLARWGSWEDAPAAPALEAGRRIRAAMGAWVEGLGPLAPLIAPITSEGKLRSLGIDAGESGLTTSWYEGPDKIDDIVELGANLLNRWDPRWRSIFGEPPRRQSAFAWRRTLDELVGALSEVLQNRELLVEDGPIAREAAWMAALALTDRGALDHRPISIAAIDAVLRGLPADVVLLDMSRKQHNVGPLRKQVDALHRLGVTEITPPWPAPDLPLPADVFICPVWLPYSEKQLLALVSAVYQGALESYEQLVRVWFPRFASRLSTAVLLPARLRAWVAPGERERPPIISWYLEPLPAGSSTTVDVQLGSKPIGFADLDEVHRNLLALRGSMADHIRIRACNGVLRVFQADAATTLAYSWLWDDLRDLKWIDGIFHE